MSKLNSSENRRRWADPSYRTRLSVPSTSRSEGLKRSHAARALRDYGIDISGSKKECRQCREKDPRRFVAGSKTECRRCQHLSEVYGISFAKVLSILEEQKNKCPVCFRPLSVSQVHVDHDHSRKVIRGLLHGPCNRVLGILKDEPESFRRAAEYLEVQR